MSDTIRLLLFLAAYVVLMKWVLPWLGVRTCMSGGCSVTPRGKHTAEPESKLGVSNSGNPNPER